MLRLKKWPTVLNIDKIRKIASTPEPLTYIQNDFTQMFLIKVSNGEMFRNRYNQVPHLAQDANGKVTNTKLDTTNEGQEVSRFPASDHKAHINIRARRHSKPRQKNKNDPQKKHRLEVVSKIFYWRA